MRLLTFYTIILLIAALTGCSGGFDSDSDNTGTIDQSIFGPDTTTN